MLLEISLAVLCAALVLYALYALVLVFPGVKKKRMKSFDGLFCDYAHRGLWGDGVPENSLAAFKKAADRGFGMELDVRLSADGEVFVLHDDDLRRVAGCDGKLSEMTSDEISRLRLTGSDEVIPKFSEVLREVDGRVPIMVELKGVDFNTAVCEATDRLLQGYKGAYCIESFNPVLVNWYRKNRPEIMRGQLVDGRKNPLSALLGALVLNIYNRPDFISYNHKRYNKTALAIATGLWGARRFEWTVHTGEEADAARKRGASIIFESFVPERKRK